MQNKLVDALKLQGEHGGIMQTIRGYNLLPVISSLKSWSIQNHLAKLKKSFWPTANLPW